MTNNHQNDTALLESIKLGDSLAFERLYDRYWKLLWQVAEKKTGDEDEAKDLVQELFIDIWNRRKTLEVKGALQTYLVASLYFKIFRHFRSKGFRQRHYQHFEQYMAQTEQVQTSIAQEEQELGNMVTLLENTIDLMPEQMKKVFTLSHVHQYSNADIANELQISVNTVKNHLKQSKKRLRTVASESPYLPLFILFWIN